MFRSLNTQFFPYSNVEELFSISQRHGLYGATDEFINGFMEPTLEPYNARGLSGLN
jgi:type II restriction enzyme